MPAYERQQGASICKTFQRYISSFLPNIGPEAIESIVCSRVLNSILHFISHFCLLEFYGARSSLQENVSLAFSFYPTLLSLEAVFTK